MIFIPWNKFCMIWKYFVWKVQFYKFVNENKMLDLPCAWLMAEWGFHNGGKYFIFLFHVSGHLEQFGYVLFFMERLIILVEWGRPAPPLPNVENSIEIISCLKISKYLSEGLFIKYTISLEIGWWGAEILERKKIFKIYMFLIQP